jgi:UDP-N-acetylmuramyl pentapeptide phosphotransferase/UDP-N-acetylglucosamine-1-phosphate transferase
MTALAYAVLIAFASYRTWALLALDTITIRPRRWLFTEARDDKRVYRWLKLFLKCPWCAGAWITFAITLATDLTVDDGVPAPVLVAVAAAAGTALLGGNDDRLMESDEDLGYAPMAESSESD